MRTNCGVFKRTVKNIVLLLPLFILYLCYVLFHLENYGNLFSLKLEQGDMCKIDGTEGKLLFMDFIRVVTLPLVGTGYIAVHLLSE